MGILSNFFGNTPSLKDSFSKLGGSSSATVEQGESMSKATVRHCQHEPKAVHYAYSGGVTAGGHTIEFAMVNKLTLHRDFVTNFADETIVEAVIDTRKYFDYVVKNQYNLEVFIRRRQMAENSILYVMGGENSTKKYKAVLLDAPTQGLGAGGKETNSVTNPEQTITIVKFQLIEQKAFDVRLSMWQGLMQNTTALDALSMILAGSGKVLGLNSVQAVKADNTDPKVIMVPNGSYIKDMAHFIQKQYGIYNFGIGSYLFQDCWYIYPLFNNDRFDHEPTKLAISVVDKKHDPYKFPRTYIVNNNCVTIVTTEGNEMLSTNASDQLQAGTGVRVVNSEENNNSNKEKKGKNDNQVTIDGKNSVTTINVVDRKDGVKNIQTVVGETSNMNQVISSVAGNAGNYLTIKWEFANPDLLVPGMPVKVVYLDNGLKTLYGTLHEYIVGYARAQAQYGDVPFICNLIMKIYVTERPEVKK